MKINIPVKKNNIYKLEILSEGYEGEGVAKVDSYPIFISNCLIGEEVETLIVKIKKGFSYGKILKILKRSPNRVEPICPVFKDCGGCSLMFMSYEHQLEFKRRQVENSLKKIGKFQDINVLNTIGMANPLRYRNKIQVPIRETIGFFSKRSHKIVEVNNCFIQCEEGDKIIEIFKNWIDKYGISCYNETTHSGDIRHIVIRKSYNTNEIMIIIISNSKNLQYKDELIDLMSKKISNVKSIYLNVNLDKTNVVLGKENILLYGERRIKEKLFDIAFNISPETFFQVNTIQAEVLCDKVLEFANLSEDEIVFDAYCGVGSISLFLAKKAKYVYGIEIVKKSVDDATENAKENNIINVEFLVGDCGDKINELIDNGIYCDCMVLDPPRKGCEEGVIRSISRNKPKKIVYVSCDHSTLARDLEKICKFGYNIGKVQPIDMFPMTHHVEVVASLIL